MIYADKNTGVLVQGATGSQGKFHINLMNEYAKEVTDKISDAIYDDKTISFAIL